MPKRVNPPDTPKDGPEGPAVHRATPTPKVLGALTDILTRQQALQAEMARLQNEAVNIDALVRELYKIPEQANWSLTSQGTIEWMG
jgi:hypothetical protein